MGLFDRMKRRLAHTWNAFVEQERENRIHSHAENVSYGRRPDRPQFSWSGERSIIQSIYTRLAVDVAGVEFRHVRLDQNDRYQEDIDSGLNERLTVEANMDQAARHFRQDIAATLFAKGTAAIVPVETSLDPHTGGFDIKQLRVGEIYSWQAERVGILLYNERTGNKEQIVLDKKFVAIVENPFYNVMNETNSTLQRLIRKLNLLDVTDDNTASGKLDIIMQLPYTVRSEAKRAHVEQRRTDIEMQLSGSKYGIAWADATEKITQLNRPAENNLLKQIEYLVKLLYSQLGLTEEIMNGTADEKTMLNYDKRTIEPIVDAIVEAMRRAFLTKTARSQRQSILYFRDPFRLVPLSEMAEIADKFTRNEILASNEIRTGLGIKPSKDPKADELRNSNMPEPTPAPSEPTSSSQGKEEGNSQNGSS